MLLQRVVEYAAKHGDLSRPFHRDVECRWQLDIRTHAGRITSARLDRLSSDSDTGKGVMRLLPVINRTRGVEPRPAGDQARYILGWRDTDSERKRVDECHTAFAELIDRWATSQTGADDPIAHIMSEFLRSGWPEQLTRPEDLSSNDTVLLVVDGTAVADATSLVPFWTENVIERKGSGKHGLCLVCGTTNALMNTIPGTGPGTLVPGAKDSAGLININESVFGYDLTKQLEHVPICVSCSDAIQVGLVSILSNEYGFTPKGEDTRTCWWLIEPTIEAHVHSLDAPDSHTISDLIGSIWERSNADLAEDLDDESFGVFCALSVGGNRSRIMVRDWMEMPLVRIRDHIRQWFRHHRIQPRFPDGHAVHSIATFAKALGKWDPHMKDYVALGSKDGCRPYHVGRALRRSALCKTPLPHALRTHLVQRIQRDGRVDEARASLIRLALNRSTTTEEELVSPGLDPDCTEPAYLAGRLFAVLAQLQQAANRPPSGSDNHRASEVEVNTTYADKFFAGAARNPRAALVSGRLDAKAWFSKLRRGGHGGLAGHFEKQLNTIYSLLDRGTGLPTTNTLRQQEQFILGYHHQNTPHAHTDTTEPAADEEPATTR